MKEKKVKKFSRQKDAVKRRLRVISYLENKLKDMGVKKTEVSSEESNTEKASQSTSTSSKKVDRMKAELDTLRSRV